ncbi:unnamed protein product [Litomosoides sigmodontis]|uniref:non-specific serine/threonine protein kinase n=1 Tax=Litomosoides sigmodontis TaxID=42156 RepID=A0A3P6UBL8_LITSI|nr:unnamed protein product [Litomosoides sigmodontis]
MRKKRIKTWGETFYRVHSNSLIKQRNDNDSPTGLVCCSVKCLEKAMIHPADNALLAKQTGANSHKSNGNFSKREKQLSNWFIHSLLIMIFKKIKSFGHSGHWPVYLPLHNTLVKKCEGGFGAVFRHVYNNRDVAIKQLHHCRHSSSTDFYSFCSELNAFRLPPSPYVVQAIAFTSSGICLQIVTEFIEGKNLQQLIADDVWHITFTQRLQLAFQIINGLMHCHNHLLLHLDVKSANIIVHANGKICKLSDFGCSRIAIASQNGLLIANDKATSGAFGTVAYKAPELFKGQRITDRADIYSFSLVLWEILTQKSVYNAIHPHNFIYDVVVHKLRPEIEQLNVPKDNYGKVLVTLLENCWSDELTKRPCALIVQQTIKQFICTKSVNKPMKKFNQ